MADEILVINAGSSSIKMSRFVHDGGELRGQFNALFEGIGTTHCRASARDAARQTLLDESWSDGAGPGDHAAALAYLVERLLTGSSGRLVGVGHRIVHGGSRYRTPVRIDAAVRGELETLIPLAPLHAPGNLQGIDAATRTFPEVPQVACFDTAFHQGRPFHADAYALPRAMYDEGIRRYGFHGLSYESIVQTMRQTAPEIAAGRMVVAHLGNGASMTAIHAGQCVETTMGFTALDGLPMGTRCGQIDPGVLLYLLQQKGLSADDLADLLYRQSGLQGISGIGSDMRDLLGSTAEAARQAIDLFVYRITYHVGALAAALGGIDAVIFTAGIGEHAAPIRERVCRNLAWLGLDFDPTANQTHQRCISRPGSRLSAWVIPTDEEGTIARHVLRTLAGES